MNMAASNDQTAAVIEHTHHGTISLQEAAHKGDPLGETIGRAWGHSKRSKILQDSEVMVYEDFLSPLLVH